MFLMVSYQLSQINKNGYVAGNIRKDKFLSPRDQQQTFVVYNKLSIFSESGKKETKRKAKQNIIWIVTKRINEKMILSLKHI